MPKPLISAETIYDEALRVLDEEGIEGLNARNLTARLRCSSKTLYQQVGIREQMERGIVAHAFAGLQLQFEGSDDWEDGIAAWCLSLRQVLLDRPALAALMSTADRDVLVGYAMQLVAMLVEHGFSHHDAIEVAGLLNHVTLSMTLSDIKAPGEWDRPSTFETAIRWLTVGIRVEHPSVD